MVSACPLCASENTFLLYQNPIDYDYGLEHDFNFCKCHDCEIIFIDPMPSFDEIFSLYPANYYTLASPGTSKRIISVLDRIYTRLNVNNIYNICGENGRLLDVGCGSGGYLKMLRQFSKTLDLYGIDIKLREELLKIKDINFFKGELSQANIEKDFFDIVIMNNLIEHVNNPGDVLANAHELLKKGGSLIGEVPNGASFGHKFWKSYWGPLHTPRHLYIFNKENLVKLFQESGFSNIKISYTFRPSGWAKSMKNILVTNGFMKHSDHTSKIYPLLILINIPFFIGEFVFKNASIMKFIAEK